MVDISPSSIPQLSCITFASGAKQLVVHEAFDTTFMPGSYSVWFTPITNVGVSLSFAGADITTFLAPDSMCTIAFSVVVYAPVASTMYSAPQSVQSMLDASDSLYTATFLPSIAIPSLIASTSAGNLPNVLSYLNMYARYSKSAFLILIPTTSISSLDSAILMITLEILPNPLIPTLIGIFSS